MSSPSQPPQLSAVIAVEGSGTGTDDAARAVQRACRGLDAEIRVVHPRGIALDALPPGVALTPVDPPNRVPHLWATGIGLARGRVIALTTGHFRVGPEWARALVATIEAGAAGASGPIRLASGTGMVGRAAYFLRYAPFMNPQPGPGAHEIPGDNAAYARADLERHRATFADGFWEVEFHRLLRAEGRQLAFTADARVEIGDAFGFREFMRQRYAHGKRSGAFRTRVQRVPVWRALLAAPLVPAVFAGRVLRRAATDGRLAAALTAVPALLLMAGAWAAGEAVGAWHARGRP